MQRGITRWSESEDQAQKFFIFRTAVDGRIVLLYENGLFKSKAGDGVVVRNRSYVEVRLAFGAMLKNR